MSAKLTALLATGLLLVTTLPAQDLSTILEAGGIDRASAPRLVGDRLLFSYDFGPGRHDGRVHSVEVAFGHENYSRRHIFRRNENDIYIFLYAVPQGAETLYYRLIVNGIWMADPANPDGIVDRWGVRISRTVVPGGARTASHAPIVHDDGTVEFMVTAPAGSRVVVVGTFNGWDPYMTPLQETEPGRFSRRIRLGSGEHLYYYVVNGLRLPDPQNNDRKWHTSGLVVSVLSLP
jgi:hypothetical protein